jgi:hypothetical protein
LIQQQLLHFLIDSYIFQVTSRGTSEILYGPRTV